MRSSVRTSVVLPVSLCLLVGASGISGAAGSQEAKKKPKATELRLEMALVRTESGGDAKLAKPTDGQAVTLATPMLTTFSGSTANVALSGTELSYSVALSPLLEVSNNSGNPAGASGKGGASTVEVQWNLRLTGKSLPGATTFALTGASRVELDKDAGIAEMTLTDPQTGRKALFQLRAKIRIGSEAPRETTPETVKP